MIEGLPAAGLVPRIPRPPPVVQAGGSALKPGSCRQGRAPTGGWPTPSGRNIHRYPDSKDTDQWGVKPDDGFGVSLTDDERIAYARYRRDRDVVHGKPGTSAVPARKNGQEKEAPFVDKVLGRALNHLRGQVKKAGPAPAARAA